jgi:hypothetical protein
LQNIIKLLKLLQLLILFIIIILFAIIYMLTFVQPYLATMLNFVMFCVIWFCIQFHNLVLVLFFLNFWEFESYNNV